MKDSLPELYRYRRLELSSTRMMMGFLTVSGVGFLCYLSASLPSTSGRPPFQSFFETILLLQNCFLFLYGSACVATSVFQERRDKTWDLQRLTPTCSVQMARGKFWGAPLFAYFLWVSCLPWLGLSLALDPSSGWDSAGDFILSLSGGFFSLSFSMLLGMAVEDVNPQGASVSILGGILGFVVFCFVNVLSFDRALPTVYTLFYGASMTHILFFSVTFLVFGLWAFWGACWRLGRDLLEPKRFWRLPAFLVFTAIYYFGVRENGSLFPGLYLAVVLPALTVAACALAFRDTLSGWKHWLSLRGQKGWLDEAPVWLTGFIVVALIALAALGYDVLQDPMDPGSRMFWVVLFFFGRDLFFLQYCRFTKSKRPEVMALVYLTLVYALPVLFLPQFHLEKALFLFVPYLNKDQGAIQNGIPAILEFFGMGFLWVTKLRLYLRSQTEPRIV